MGAEVIIFGQSLNSQFLKGLTHSAVVELIPGSNQQACTKMQEPDRADTNIGGTLADKVCRSSVKVGAVDQPSSSLLCCSTDGQIL